MTTKCNYSELHVSVCYWFKCQKLLSGTMSHYYLMPLKRRNESVCIVVITLGVLAVATSSYFTTKAEIIAV